MKSADLLTQFIEGKAISKEYTYGNGQGRFVLADPSIFIMNVAEKYISKVIFENEGQVTQKDVSVLTQTVYMCAYIVSLNGKDFSTFYTPETITIESFTEKYNMFTKLINPSLEELIRKKLVAFQEDVSAAFEDDEIKNSSAPLADGQA